MRRSLGWVGLGLMAVLGLPGTAPRRRCDPRAGVRPGPGRGAFREGRRPVPDQALLRLPRQRQAEGRPGPRQVPGRAGGPEGPQGLGERPGDGPDRRDAAQGAAAAGRRRRPRRRCGPSTRCSPSSTAPGRANAGRVTLRRLNRAEYNNTIRDLVGVDFKPADDFPADDVGYGFDNIGDVLSLSPLLLEKYLAAAEAILDQAIVIADPPEPTKTRLGGLRASRGAGETRRAAARSCTRAARSPAQSYFDEGDYIVRVEAYGQQAGDEPVRVAFRVDGEDVQEFDVDGRSRRTRRRSRRRSGSRPGRDRVAVAVPQPVHRPADAATRDQTRPARSSSTASRSTGRTTRRRRSCPRVAPADHGPPAGPAAARGRPRDRRPVRHPGLPPAGHARRGRAPAEARRPGREGGRALRGRRPAGARRRPRLARTSSSASSSTRRTPSRARRYPISEYELATRLSYFLWSSMPDDELFALAAKGQLRREPRGAGAADARGPEVGRVRRELRRPVAAAPEAGLRRPRPEAVPRLRRRRCARRWSARPSCSSRRSCARTAASSTCSTPTSRFVNERLAKHYGIAGVDGRRSSAG